jgi:hypothetical protein
VTPEDVKRAAEQRVVDRLAAWTPLERAIAYFLIYAEGERMSGIEQRILKLARDEARAA